MKHLHMLLVAAAMTVAGSAFAQEAASPTGQFDAPAANWLIVQNADSMSYDGKSLTLTGVTPQTIMFTDRPQRMAGDISTKQFIDDWTAGKDSFESDPPNASLSVLVGDKEETVVVELTNPQLSPGTLTYDVKVLEGSVPQQGEATTLFIDWWYGPRGGICHHGPWGGVRCGWGPWRPW